MKKTATQLAKIRKQSFRRNGLSLLQKVDCRRAWLALH